MNAAKKNTDFPQAQIRFEDTRPPIIIDKNRSPFVSLADMPELLTGDDNDRISSIFATSNDIAFLFPTSE